MGAGSSDRFQRVLLSVRLPDSPVAIVPGLLSLLATVSIGAVPVAESVLVFPVAGLAVGASIYWGGLATLIVAVGYLVGQAVSGYVGVLALVSTVSYLTMGLVAAVVWHETPLPERPLQNRTVRQFAEGLFVTVGTVSVAGGAVAGWGHELFGLGPFYRAGGFALSFGLSILLVTPPVLLLSGLVGDSVRPTSSDERMTRQGHADSGGSVLMRGGAPAAVSLVWFLLGWVGSVGYQTADVLLAWDPDAFAIRGLEFLLLVHDDAVLGTGGRYVQGAFGGLMFFLLLLTVARRSHTDHLMWGGDQ